MNPSRGNPEITARRAEQMMAERGAGGRIQAGRDKLARCRGGSDELEPHMVETGSTATRGVVMEPIGAALEIRCCGRPGGDRTGRGLSVLVPKATGRSSSARPHRPFRNTAGAALLLPWILLAACAAPRAPLVTPPSEIAAAAADWRYALVIDASSSASTLFVYQWRPDPGGGAPRIVAAPGESNPGEEPWSHRVRPGLGAYADQPDEAARSLEPLIAYALERIGDDPATLSHIPLYLRATAGVRALEISEQEAIMASVASYLDATPLGATSARVISGTEEAVYGWLAVNDLLGLLRHGGLFPTVGALDLGGASTQIAFLPVDYPTSGGTTITLGGNTYHLYAHSYQGLGQDEFRKRHATEHCFPPGYQSPAGSGSGDWESCRATLRRALEAPCTEEPCSLMGTYQPPPFGDFLAFSVYAYTADFFDLGQRLSPADLAAAGSAFCATPWAEQVAAHPSYAQSPYAPNYCFAAAYIVTLLTDGYGFPVDSDRLHAPIRVQGSEIGWARGALLWELAGGGD